MAPIPTHAGRGTFRLARPALALLLVAGLAAGIALASTGPAMADPSPMPGPGQTISPPPGIPDTGSCPSPSGTLVLPGQNPNPTANPNPTPSPIGPPPTGNPNPNPTPTPNPNPTPGGGLSTPPATTTDDDPAWYDIPGQIRRAINDFFDWMVRTGMAPVMQTLGETVLSTPDLTNNAQVKAIWTTCLVIANAVFVLFVVLGGFVVTSHETLQTRHGLKQILPRLAIGGVGANMSLVLIAQVMKAVNALTAAIAGQGVDGPAAATAIQQAMQNVQSGSNIMVSLLVLAALVMAIIVVLTFILRVAAMILLIGVSPLALVCHATPQTEGLAYTWWRAFGACLGMQVAQAVVMLATVRVFLTPNGTDIVPWLGVPASGSSWLGILVCLTMLWVQIKLPGWTKQFVLGPLGQSKGRGLLGQIVSTILTVKTLGAAAGILGGAKAAGTAARRGAMAAPRPRPSGPGRTPRPAPARRGPSRPSPAPAGPAAFSHAPVTHTPLAQPAGTTVAPAFSNATPPATPGPAPASATPPAVFSAAPGTPPATASAPSAAPPPSVAPFSHAPSTSASSASVSNMAASGSAPASTRASAVAFSAAPKSQIAPKRPPAPVTPAFSAAPAPPPRPRPTAAKRAPRASQPTGTSRAPARPSPPVPPAVPSPAVPSPTARPSPPVPSPSPRPVPDPAAPEAPEPARPARRRPRQE
ncbi:hypothetical protein [Dactylosporangium sp. NPDC051484]|uniref:hypothetical protein n=1 Tax=Dactylosporangium sp. NPDC051484 TaxID=3154942 RepID=UPI00344E23C1